MMYNFNSPIPFMSSNPQQQSQSSLFHDLNEDALYIQQLHYHLLQQVPLTAERHYPAVAVDGGNNDNIADTPKGIKTKKREKMPAASKKRTSSSRRDRHTKINTASGLRDRRMRLSLDVARNFFGLQDLLGFDKASRTVEWLLEKARFAIMELAREDSGRCVVFGGVNSTGPSSSSDCEVLSAIEAVQTTKLKKKKTTKTMKAIRRLTFHPLAKQSREKARERARERTREKTRRRLEIRLSARDERGRDRYSTHRNKDVPVTAEVEEETSVGVREPPSSGALEDSTAGDSMVINGSDYWSSPADIFSLHHNSGILHELTDIQVHHGKQWERTAAL